MAEITAREITTTFNLVLDEQEAKALDALAGYGTDPFLKTFYKEMGEAYLKPHEAGLRRLFEAVRHGTQFTPAVRLADDARSVFAGRKIAVDRPRAPPLARDD